VQTGAPQLYLFDKNFTAWIQCQARYATLRDFLLASPITDCLCWRMTRVTCHPVPAHDDVASPVRQQHVHPSNACTLHQITEPFSVATMHIMCALFISTNPRAFWRARPGKCACPEIALHEMWARHTLQHPPPGWVVKNIAHPLAFLYANAKMRRR